MDVSPRLLVVRRGQEEESFHCGRAVVATATGETVLAIGDAEASSPATLKLLRWRSGNTTTVTLTLKPWEPTQLPHPTVALSRV